MEKVDKPFFSRPFAKPEPVLAVFAKQPLAGKVKTRLCPPLSETEAARLYQVSLAETISTLWECPLRMVLFYAGERAWFEQAFPEVLLVPQTKGGLGVRLQAAADQLFAAGSGPVLFIGSDSPDLPCALVTTTVDRLQQFDVVTVPCLDGGYALVGMNRPCPEIFEDIPWSTAEVLATTRRQAERAGLAYHELDPWDDLDDLASLRRLAERSPVSATARYVQARLARYLKG
ncbi:MAG TPA: TIGR04282 family arsenosugar biosynthesis glycosyltransferase [Desulfuromonadales bacterium]|nr:TIGR04282 family arsenosugar biosynthesis glycosyltransferase [Desulfuromonadales bacterium]